MAAPATLKLAFILSATDKMSRIVDEAVKKSTDKLSAFERTTSKVGRTMMTSGTMMVGAGIAGAAGLLSAGKAATDYAGSIKDMSEATGVGVEAWQKMTYAAKISGIEQEKLATSMIKFDKVIASAAGGSKIAGQIFKDLGIKIKDAGGNMRAPDEIFKDVAEKLSSVKDGALKTALSCEIFGKSGAELMPMLNEGAAGLDKLYKAAVESGNILGGETINKCDDFGKKLDAVGLQIKGVGLQIGAALIPTLHELTNRISTTIDSVTKWMQENPALANTIGKVGLAAAGLLITLGGAAVIIGGLTFIAGQFGKVFMGVVGVFKFGATAINVFRKSMFLFRIQYAAIVVGQKIATVAQWLFNSALSACPITWIIVGIMAVIAVVVALVKNWDKASALFAKLWVKIKDIFGKAWQWIAQMFLDYTPYGLIFKHWDKISAFFVELWVSVKSVFSATWNWIKGMFMQYHPIGILISNWSNVIAWFGQMWRGIKTIFTNGWQGIVLFITELPAQAFEWGKSIITGLWNGILSMIDKVVSGFKGLGSKIATAFKSFMGINSPSKLFAEYGVNLTQGLIVGMDRGGNAVESASGGMASRATDGIGGMVQGGAVSASSIMNGGNTGVSVNYSPQITISGPVTPEAEAEFRKMLRQHASEIVSIIRRDTENAARLSFNV